MDDKQEGGLSKNNIREEKLSESEKQDKDITDKIKLHHVRMDGINKLRHKPIAVLTQKPINVLILTLPFAFFTLIIGFLYIINEYGTGVLFSSTLIDDILVISLLIAVLPLAVLDYIEGRRIRSLEMSLPNFFRDVAGMNESGMTLTNAIHIVADGEYGKLTPYVKKLDNEMSWGIPFVTAIHHFGVNVGTPLAIRSVDLIAKASTAGGDVSEVLQAAANDSYEFINLDTERRNNMMIYVVIVIISFLVFLFVIAVMTGSFLTTMADVGSTSPGGSGGASFGGSLDIAFYNRLFSHAAMIQGFFSGLVAGQMGEGRTLAGLKYSVIMLIIAWVTFRFFI
ncbi:MAG: type II secretion system F family protein [Euryarchaeota archaeon]|nr:type II secretion system F family protein [Euryarchaeota archaeon]